jgi:hypothetical protein
MIIKRKLFSSEVIIKRPVIKLRDGKRVNDDQEAVEEILEEPQDTEEEYDSEDYLEENNN